MATDIPAAGRPALDRVQKQAAREVAAMFRPLAEAVPVLIRREAIRTPDGQYRLDEIGRIRIMHAVDAYLDEIFGRFPGDRSTLEEVIIHWANVARAAPVRAAAADIRRRIGRDLLEARRGPDG